MNVETLQFRRTVKKLIAELQPDDCLDYCQYRLAREYHVLPIGFDLWSYLFLTTDGEVMWAGWAPLEVKLSKAPEHLAVALRLAAEKYPSLRG